jgi:hypothetical protein
MSAPYRALSNALNQCEAMCSPLLVLPDVIVVTDCRRHNPDCDHRSLIREKPMSLATIHSRALDALDAPEVRVEVHLANGLPSFTLVGLADTEVKEARERVRAALVNSGFAFPHNKRITVNLAPADLPKETGRFVADCAGHPRRERPDRCRQARRP